MRMPRHANRANLPPPLFLHHPVSHHLGTPEARDGWNQYLATVIGNNNQNLTEKVQQLLAVAHENS